MRLQAVAVARGALLVDFCRLGRPSLPADVAFAAGIGAVLTVISSFGSSLRSVTTCWRGFAASSHTEMTIGLLMVLSTFNSTVFCHCRSFGNQQEQKCRHNDS